LGLFEAIFAIRALLFLSPSYTSQRSFFQPPLTWSYLHFFCSLMARFPVSVSPFHQPLQSYMVISTSQPRCRPFLPRLPGFFGGCAHQGFLIFLGHQAFFCWSTIQIWFLSLRLLLPPNSGHIVPVLSAFFFLGHAFLSLWQSRGCWIFSPLISERLAVISSSSCVRGYIPSADFLSLTRPGELLFCPTPVYQFPFLPELRLRRAFPLNSSPPMPIVSA